MLDMGYINDVREIAGILPTIATDNAFPGNDVTKSKKTCGGDTEVSGNDTAEGKKLRTGRRRRRKVPRRRAT